MLRCSWLNGDGPEFLGPKKKLEVKVPLVNGGDDFLPWKPDHPIQKLSADPFPAVWFTYRQCENMGGLHAAIVVDDESDDTVPNGGGVTGPFFYRKVTDGLIWRRILAESSSGEIKAGLGRTIAKLPDLKGVKIWFHIVSTPREK
jgi:hypothetical protein